MNCSVGRPAAPSDAPGGSAPAPVADPAVAPEPDDEDDDEGESYADWNVPSWQELIASLYRPDR